MYWPIVLCILLLSARINAYKLNIGLPQIVKSPKLTRDSHDVYIGNLDFLLTKQDVMEAMLKKILGYEQLTVMRYNETHNKGYGFLRFADTKRANAALELLDNLIINNRTTRISFYSSNAVTFSNLHPSINAAILKKICDDTIAKDCLDKLDFPVHPTSGMPSYSIVLS